MKAHKCARVNDYVTFVAYSGSLPSTFVDGSDVIGTSGAVRVDEVEPQVHVELVLRHAATTIVIRQTANQFFSVAIKMPRDVISATAAQAHQTPEDFLPLQLCLNSCPQSEVIDYREILVTSSSRSPRRAAERAPLTLNTAEQICQLSSLVDFYLDSCVYDLLATGDTNFSEAVRLAQADEQRLLPEAAQLHANRTYIDRSLLEEWRQRSRLNQNTHPASANSAASPRSSLSATHLLTSLFCVLIASHLNYVHRTSFVLLAL